jgi:hypothetical protein
MHHRLPFLAVVVCACALLITAGCSDTGVNPSDEDDSTSLGWFAAQGGNDTRGNKGHGGGGGGGGGGGKLNCKKDKGLDQPIEIQSIDVQSPMRIHITAGGGWDASNGVVLPNWYEVIDESGTATNVPSGIYVGDASDLLDVHVEGMRPGATYTVRLHCQDLCGNTGYSANYAVTMPDASGDATPPVATTPVARTRSVFVATFRVVSVEATDNTGVSRVEFYFEGALEHTLEVAGHPRLQLDGETPEYEWFVPDELSGRSGVVMVKTYDPAGNVTETSASVTL